MRVEITVDGKTYISKATNEFTHSEAAEMFYDDLENINKFKLEMEDGSILMLPKDAAQRAHIIFIA